MQTATLGEARSLFCPKGFKLQRPRELIRCEELGK